MEIYVITGEIVAASYYKQTISQYLNMDRAKIGKRNRINGHNFERYVKSVFIKLGFLNTATSRAVSKVADDKGIDLVNTGNIGVQCKYTVNRPNYIEILKSMPLNLLNIIFHKQPKGKVYVIMEEHVFAELLKSYVNEWGTKGATDQAVLLSPSSKPERDKKTSGNRRGKTNKGD